MRKPAILLGTATLLAIGGLALRRTLSEPRWERWSDAATWNGRPPKPGDRVVIPKGRRVLLDVTPPRLGRLEIEGALKVEDRGLSLCAETVLVSGRLTAGSSAHRLRRSFTLALDATNVAKNPDAGAMVVIGRLEMAGADLARTWTRLDGTASAGATTIRVTEPIAVQKGDRIVLASTGFDPDQCETAEVAATEGATVRLAQPLRHGHFGRITDGADERAEVGLLSRNVTIRGLGPEGQGGDVMVTGLGTAVVDGVEFDRMGKAGRLSRYPLHFHLAGDQSASLVRNVSIHDGFNRALTIHGTQNLRVEGLVAYRSFGHLVFLEDGVETGNRIVNSLAIRAMAPPQGRRLLDSDARPACFWETHPGNDLVGDVAAASDGEGFWLAFPKGPTGPSASLAEYRRVLPRVARLGRFEGNRAHSNRGNGLFVDGPPNPKGVYEAPSYRPKGGAVFEGMVAYKNGKRGVWMRGTGLEVRHAVLADNPIGITLAASESVLRDSLVVGETENGGGLLKPGAPRFPIRGFEFYDGLVGVSGVTFRNFVPSEAREAGALSGLRYTPFFVNPNNYVERVRFENAKRVFFDHVPSVGTGERSADGYRTLCFKDRDGSLTGAADATVSIANPFLAVPGHTQAKPEWNAYVTQGRLARLFIDVPQGDPKARLSCVIRHLDAEGRAHRMGGNPYEGGATSYQAMVRPNEPYRVGFDGPTPRSLRLALRYFRTTDRIRLELPLPHGPYRVRLNRRRDLTAGVAAEGSILRVSKGRLLVDLAATAGPNTVLEILPA